MLKKIALPIFLVIILLDARRPDSYPRISGDTFKRVCTYIYDNDVDDCPEPCSVKAGDVVFINGDYLGEYVAKVHQFIQVPYILVTHNTDYPAPGYFANILEDEKLVAWFAQNVERTHPKLFPLPIGIANRQWPHGNIEKFDHWKDQEKQHPEWRTKLLYMNFTVKTNPKCRQPIWDLFASKDYCTAITGRSVDEYLSDLVHHKFTISPHGNGLDCHRTWEALYMGCIPIVLSSSLDVLYEGLPVLIVQDWADITEELLEKKYVEFRQGYESYDRMYVDFWLKKVRDLQYQTRSIAVQKTLRSSSKSVR